MDKGHNISLKKIEGKKTPNKEPIVIMHISWDIKYNS